MVALAAPFGATAQSPLVGEGQVLIYERVDGSAEYIRLTAPTRTGYTLPTGGRCSAISPIGRYFAQTSLQRDDLFIYALEDLQVIAQMPWSSEWEPCAFHWVDSTTISIRESGGLSDWAYFDISSADFTPVDYQWPQPQYPSLPDWMPSIEQDFVLPSPQENIYLYQRCPAQITNPEGTRCSVLTEMMIYDAARQRVIETLSQPDRFLMSGYDNITEHTVSPGNAVWSPDGRYLAYQYQPDSWVERFTLRMFDMATETYVDTDWISAEIAEIHGLQWAPEGHRLAFWIKGRIGETQPGDENRFLTTPVVFYPETLEFVWAETPIEHVQWGLASTWAPDGHGLVFVDYDTNLIYMDALTGETSILDTHVDRVVAWTSAPAE